MKTTTVTLSSNTTGSTHIIDELHLTDATRVLINLHDVEARNNPPLFVKIQWGDGSDPVMSKCNFSSPYSANTESNAITRVENKQQYDILLKEYEHIYTTSSNCLVRMLSCYVSVEHLTTENETRFIIPIKITSPSFHTKIIDMALLQTSFAANDTIRLTIGTEAESAVIETLLNTSILDY